MHDSTRLPPVLRASLVGEEDGSVEQAAAGPAELRKRVSADRKRIVPPENDDRRPDHRPLRRGWDHRQRQRGRDHCQLGRGWDQRGRAIAIYGAGGTIASDGAGGGLFTTKLPMPFFVFCFIYSQNAKLKNKKY